MAETTKKYVSFDKLGLYNEKIKGVISAGDAAALQDAKDYADGLATNYDAAGSANTALESAKAYADGKDSAIAEAKKAGTDAAAAASVADGKAVAAQSAVDALDAFVGELPEGVTATTVVGYVQEKTSGVASEGAMTELSGRVTQAEKDIDAIEADYLKGADKEELAGDIANVQAAVEAEAARADAAEKANAAAIKAIQDDYLKAADKTELQGNIDTVAGAVERLTNGVSVEEIDGVNDLIQYVKDHGTEVTGMQGDIAENAEDIAGLDDRMVAAEEAIEAVEGAVDTKVEQSAYDAKVAELAGADTAMSGRIAAIEGKFGGAEGSVEDMIADAKAEAIEAAGTAADTKDEAVLTAAKKYADDEDAKIESRVDALETASGTHALASDLTALTGRVTTAEGKVTTLEGKMTAVEAKAAANETAIAANATEIAKKAAQADHEALAGRVATLETWHNNFTEVSEEEINSLFA